MAQEELGTEREGRKPKSRRRRHGHLSRGQDPALADAAPPPADDEFNQPADAQALREARLQSMVTPAAARKKMKIEYQYSRPVRTPTTRPKSATASSGLLGRRSSVLSSRPKSTASRPPRKSTTKTNGDEYVYKTKNPSMIDRRDFQKEHDDAVKAAKEKRKTSTSTTKTTTPKVERRKTEPAPAVRRSSTTATTRPPARKTARSAPVTDVKDDRTPADSFPDKPAPAETVVSTAKSTKSQRTSILGSLFTKPPPVPEKLVSCLTCGADDVPLSKSARLPCTHRMCHSCLRRIFKMSIKDPAHMPPRCCTEDHIALKHVDALFDQEFKKVWNRKFKEYNAKNRVYCPRKGCGEWIQAKHMRIEQGRKIGVCSKCHLAVCAICNQKAHRSRECPKDPTVQQFNEIAKQRGWVKCYNCSATVELKEGCNHMTCRCTAEFCMVCGKKWKGCDCPWFNYEAVRDVNGDPIRYQQEMDRRREQEQRDEQMARQMAGLDVRPRLGHGRAPGEDFLVGTAADGHMDVNFLQQAREALAANYQNAEVAARGLLGAWLTGRENPLPPGLPGDPAQQPAIGRRRTPRVRHTNA